MSEVITNAEGISGSTKLCYLHPFDIIKIVGGEDGDDTDDETDPTPPDDEKQLGFFEKICRFFKRLFSF